MHRQFILLWLVIETELGMTVSVLSTPALRNNAEVFWNDFVFPCVRITGCTFKFCCYRCTSSCLNSSFTFCFHFMDLYGNLVAK